MGARSSAGRETVTHAALFKTLILCALATAFASCSDKSPTSPSNNCSFAVTGAPSSPVSAAGSEVTLSIATTAGCGWSASSTAAFITPVGAATGTGNGSVRFAVQANSGAVRQGVIQVAGQSVSVTQAAGTACELTVTPEQTTVAAEGADIALDVIVSSGQNCAWTATANAPFITVKEGGSGTGAGRVVLTVAANSGDARVGTASVAGRTVTLLQDSSLPPAVPCEFTVSPSSVQAPAAGLASVVITVTKTQGGTCPWVTIPDGDFISIIGPRSGEGSGTFTMAVAPNPGPSRGGEVLLSNNINGPKVRISQASGVGACAFSVSPTQASAPDTGGNFVVVITPILGQNCAWTAVPQVNFLTISGNDWGNGAGSVTIAVGPNAGSQRTGTVNVAGQTVTVTQAGPSVPAAVVLSIQSDVGDYVGQGQTRTYVLRGAEARIEVDLSFEGLWISMPAQPLGNWSLGMTDGSMQRPVPGLYDLAERSGFQSAGHPGLAFSMDSRGCNTSTGRFLVQEAVYGAGNSVQRFHARFESYCENRSRGLHGEIWVDAQGSTTPPPLQAFPVSGPPTSLFAFQSAPGDPVGRGMSVDHNVSTVRFSPREASGRPGVTVTIDELPGSQIWQLSLSAPSGQHLTPGTYENAASYISTPAGVPGLLLSANGTGCGTVAGRFVVLEAVYGPKDEVYRFHATFEQTCNGFGTPLRGEIRIVADPWR